MALLARIEDQEGVRRVGFASSPVRIGRNRLNEICLENPAVSQWHALVRFDESQGQVTVMDLGSTNGTRLNGIVLRARVPAPVGQQDQVSVGPVNLNLFMAPIPPELLETGQQSSFDTRQLGGKATIMLDAEDGPTQFFNAAGGLQSPATVVMPPGTRLDPNLVAETTVGPGPEEFHYIQSSIERTKPAYESYRQAWQEVLRQLRQRIKDAPPHLREYIAVSLKMEFPQVTKEPDFHAIIQEFNINPGVDDEVDAVEWLRRLKHGSDATTPAEQFNPRLAMERVGALLETFAESFISLRRGYEQFGEDMALRVVHEQTPLTAARDHRGVLQVLLDWNADGTRSVEDLKRAFADLAMHQVALLHGTVEGVRFLLHDIGPNALEAGESNTLSKINLKSVSLPFFKTSRLWKIYKIIHRALSEEDRFTRVVFGRPFARAYFDMTGANVQDQEPPVRQRTQEISAVRH